MKKRGKRRLDYERAEQLKRSGKTVDAKLRELVEQYEALNDTLKKELPKLSALTVKVGNICLGNFVSLQVKWFEIWKEKIKMVVPDAQGLPEVPEILADFKRDYQFSQDTATKIGLINPAYRGRTSQSTGISMSSMNTMSTDDGQARSRPRPPDLAPRDRGLSAAGDQPVPTLPTPDFGRRDSGQFTMSPTSAGPAVPSPHHYYFRDYYAGIGGGYRAGGASPITPDPSSGARSFAAPGSGRPSTGRSYDSTSAPRQSADSSNPNRRDSNSTYGSNYPGLENRRFSGLFHSALPLEEGETSQRSSRASSRERTPAANGYNVLWLAASLFEFNIETTKHEAGYPYLVYQAGEVCNQLSLPSSNCRILTRYQIFDVIAEKGELWLAKNQDDPTEQVGWIWSKHFAKLADS
jgi:dynamin-binding protein